MAINESTSFLALLAEGKIPEIYALQAEGSCMSPHYEDGDHLVISRDKPVRKGDIVVIHFLPEAVKPGGYEALVKRIKVDLGAVKFPWAAGNSNIVPMLPVEQLNPPRTFYIDYDKIAAIHRVLCPGVGDGEKSVQVQRCQLEAL